MASLTERLRMDIEKERDRLAQATFNDLVEQGAIEFSLRADALDYELPHAVDLMLASQPPVL